jgi:hypothetical protein
MIPIALYSMKKMAIITDFEVSQMDIKNHYAIICIFICYYNLISRKNII